ncbi:MAG: hypothetical protein AABY64_08800 [Bdellovibrionota bacterium]
MKTVSAYIKTISSLIMLVAFLGMAACAKKSGSGANRAQSARGVQTGVTNTTGFLGNGQQQVPASCNGSTQAAGRLIDDGSLMGAFRNNYAEFLGEEIGDLDGSANSTSTGVDIQLRVKLNGQTVVGNQSGLMLSIYDSEVNELGVIEVKYDSATQANVNASTGEFTLTFQDSYGQVMVQGRNTSNQIQGRVSYQNSGMSQAKSLGAFTLSSCAVFY